MKTVFITWSTLRYVCTAAGPRDKDAQSVSGWTSLSRALLLLRIRCPQPHQSRESAHLFLDISWEEIKKCLFTPDKHQWQTRVSSPSLVDEPVSLLALHTRNLQLHHGETPTTGS